MSTLHDKTTAPRVAHFDPIREEPGVYACVATLRAARARIADPANFASDIFARDGRGRACLPKAPTARRWCIFGAVLAEDVEDGSPEVHLLYEAADRRYGKSVATVALVHGHAGAMLVFDDAIAAAERLGGHNG